MRYTHTQMQQARKTNLYDFIMRNHSDRFRKEGNSLRAKDNHSVSIREGYSGYIDFASGEKGNSVDYLVKHLGYTVTEAVIALCGGSVTAGAQGKEVPKIEKLPPVFPDPIKGQYRNLYAYLLKRGISRETIQMLLDQKILYQDGHYNIIFANKERDWGEMRGTNTYVDTRCMHRLECNQYKEGEHQWCQHMQACQKYEKDPFQRCIRHCRGDGFWWFQTGEHPRSVYVTEGAIDAISLYELHRQDGMTDPVVYASIGGVWKQAAIDRIKRHILVILAVDNDEAGSICRKRNYELESIIPHHKDWNEDLLTTT